MKKLLEDDQITSIGKSDGRKAEWKKLKDVCIMQRGQSITKKSATKGCIPVVSGGKEPAFFIDKPNRDADCITVAGSGAGAGYVQYWDKPIFVCDAFSIIGKSEILLTKYVYYYLISIQKIIYSTKKGAGIPHVHIQSIEDFKIPVLSFDEQNRIISIFDTLERIISLREEQLAKFDELVKARFSEMFGDPIANDKKWDLKTLPELGELGRGISKHRPRNAPELLGGKYPLVQTGDVANANLYITDYKSTYSEQGFRQSKMWKAGTLCITIAATIAKTAILAFDSCFPDSVVGFMPNNKTNCLFINYWFSFFQKIIEKQAPMVAQKNINLQLLSKLNVINPPISLQNEFAEFVLKVNKVKENVKLSLDKLRVLFDSLMQEYFG